MKLLGLDYGNSRIGVAVGDAKTRYVKPHSFFRHQGWGPDVKRVQQLMAETGASAVVLGLPRNMDGSLGPQAQETMGFGKRLEEAGIPLFYQDERLSSFEAEEALQASGLNSRQIRDKVDQTAACLILTRYLDSHGYNT